MPKQLNILHVTQSACAAGGGVAKYIWDLHDWMLAHNATATRAGANSASVSQPNLTSRVVACDTSGHADNTNATVLARKWPAFLGRTDIAQWLQQL
jgi:hypothetical protein